MKHIRTVACVGNCAPLLRCAMNFDGVRAQKWAQRPRGYGLADLLRMHALDFSGPGRWCGTN
jgi:hypothetical protein